jgi:4-oxalocrotonate tautomerase
MPIVEITIFEGRSDETKLRAMRAITDAVVDSLDAPRGDVRVIIREIPRSHMTVGGELKLQRRPAAEPPPETGQS